MPASSASRGERKRTALPSTRYSPSSGAWTPASILMSVLLPAPLSPSRQCTSPRASRNVTPDRAITGPKYLLTFSGCRIRSSDMSVACVLAPAQRDAPADVVVEQHRHQQHAAEEHAVPVVVDARVADA